MYALHSPSPQSYILVPCITCNDTPISQFNAISSLRVRHSNYKMDNKVQRKLILPTLTSPKIIFTSPPKKMFMSFFKYLLLFYAPRLTCNAIPLLVYSDFTSSEWLHRSDLRPQEFIRNLKYLSYSTFVLLILRKIFACPLGKLSTEFTSLITKSTSPGLSGTTLFARWTN